jgi:1,4-dihydroxy-6-naphthoate synthase
MYYGLDRGLVGAGDLRFEFVREDIQTLNERAVRGELDITAVSVHAYAHISDQYALLPTGASFGDGYGPVVVARESLDKDRLRSVRIASPGLTTSGFLALQLWLGRRASELDWIHIPFDQIFTAVRNGRADAGVVIHEGQLTWRREGLTLCADLGQWWKESNEGLPLPLGANVIHKRIPEHVRREAARRLEAGIRFSLEHREEAVRYALDWARDMGADLADKFVGMYVNHWTLDYGERGRESIRRFLTAGVALGSLGSVPSLEFVES